MSMKAIQLESAFYVISNPNEIDKFALSNSFEAVYSKFPTNTSLMKATLLLSHT